MSAPENQYQQGNEWIQRAHAAYARIGTDPKASDRSIAAAHIAAAHFTAAMAGWDEPELMGPPLTSVPDEPALGAVQYGPWPQTTPERT